MLPKQVEAAGCPAGSHSENQTSVLGTPTLTYDCIDDATGNVVGTTLLGTAFKPSHVECRGNEWSWTNFGTCVGRWFSVWLGTTLISLGALLLALTGLLFNFVIDTTVISFNSSLYALVNSSADGHIGLTTIWSLFRDLANVGILGIFTFIAISIILGRVTFNNKRLVANVLIVALLINFSLVFSKIVIQTSNLFACQFYKVMVNETTCNSQTASSVPLSSQGTLGGDEFAKNGIAGEFLSIMGMKSLTKTKSALAEVADKEDNGFLALSHGFFISFFLIVASIAFALMALMLIVRAIMLLFLMCVSPIAFAAYALPQWENLFTSWRDSLVRHAFFAPILLVLLWMSSALAKGASTGKGLLGDALARPAGAGNMEAIFLYLFTIGLLFGALYLASRFAKSVPGMGVGLGIAAQAGALPFLGAGLGSGLAGRALRNYVGGRAYGRVQELGDEIDRKRLDMSLDPAVRSKELKGLRSSQLKSLATAGKEFNIMNAKSVQKLAGLTGMKGIGVTAGGGYAGRVAEGAKAKADGYKEAALSSADQTKIVEKKQESSLDEKAIHEEKMKSHREQTQLEKESLTAQREAAKRTLETSKQSAATLEKEIKDLEKTLKDGGGSVEEKGLVAEKVTQKQTELRESKVNIENARRLATEKHAELVDHNKTTSEVSKEHYKELERINLDLAKKKEEALQGIKAHTEHLQTSILKDEGGHVGTEILKSTGIKEALKGLTKNLETLSKENTRAQARADLRTTARTTPPAPAPTSPKPPLV